MRTSWAPERAADTGGVDTTATFVVADGEIREIFYEYGFPDYRTGGDALMAWIAAQHPGETDYEWYPKQEIPGPIEAALLGTNRLRYGAEWAAFGTETVEAAYAAYASGDVDGFVAAFDGAILVDAESDTELVAAFAAAGVPLVVSDCRPAGVAAEALRIRCAIVASDIAGGVSGIELAGSISMLVRPDGLIVNPTDDLAWDDVRAFDEAFRGWLESAHPEVAAEVAWVENVPSAADIAAVLPFYAEFVASSDDYPHT